jgi:polyhydroxyalkanoate synthesis regulator phasin
MRKRLIAGAVAGTVALGAVGATVAFAETGGSSTPQATPSPGTSPPAGAPNAQARQAQREAQIKDQLKKLVAAGTITQAQADKVASTLAAAGEQGAPGGGFGGHGPGGAGRLGDLLQPELQAAAKALGLTTDQLQTQMRGGSTLAQIAKKQGKDVNTLVGAITTAAKAQLDAAVKAGRLNQDMATKVEGDLQKRITDLVNNGFPKAAPNGRNWGKAPGGAPNFGQRGQGGSTPSPSATGSASADPSSFSNA